MSGEYWVERSWVSDLAKTLHELSPNPPAVTVQPPLCRLTSREREVVAAVLSGCTNKEIAQKHNISDQTVKNHLTAIYDKIGVSSRLELALFATKHGLETYEDVGKVADKAARRRRDYSRKATYARAS